MEKEKRYKPGQIVTIRGERYRISKPEKKMKGVCHLCGLATLDQSSAPGHLCGKYCYRRYSGYNKQGVFVQYYLKRMTR